MYKVMLVDDEPFILDGLKKLIDWDELGLEIAAEASDGDQALELLKATSIDILLTDIKMPNLGGIELIRKIKQQRLNIKTIILSGYDDFEYVKEGILLGIENYLLKSVNEEELKMTLLNTVEKIESELLRQMKARQNENILRENILYRWVTGKISRSELSERASLLGIDLDSGGFQVCLLKLLGPVEPEKIQEDKQKFSEALNICSEVIGEMGEVFVFKGLFEEAVILLCGETAHLENSKKQDLLEKCMMKINMFLKVNAFAVIGCIIKESDNVYKSYESAKALMDYSLILPYNSILDSSNHEQHVKERQDLIDIDFNVLKKSIALRDKAKALQFIDDIFGNQDTLVGITPKYLKDISIEILYNILNSADTIHQTKPLLPDSSESLYTKLLKMGDKSEMAEWLKYIAEIVTDKLSEDDNKLNPLIKRTVKYINSNYSSDISLKSLSASFNANAAYLGRLFREETGEMFSSYINRIRVEKAKELMLNTRLGIDEIALKVGYSNPKYFYDIFKRICGVNPLQYKRDSSNF